MNKTGHELLPPNGHVDRLLMIVGGLMALVGFLYAINAIVFSFLATFGAAAWQEVPCTIVSSDVLPTSGVMDVHAFEPLIRFRYSVEGHEYMSNVYTRGVRHYDNESAVQKIVDKYPPGTTSTCYVNPANPADAVLTKSVGNALPMGGYSFIIGLVGLFLFWTGWRRRAAAHRSKQNATASPPA